MSISFKLLSLYSRVAPTERGAYRLVRRAVEATAASSRNGRFQTPDRIRMDLDLNAYPDCCMAFGLYELDTYRTLKRLLTPGSWFVDCGANIGYFSLLASKWVGRSGKVDAFEPDSANRARLTRNISQNDAQGITVHPLALGDRNCDLMLYHPTERVGANHGMTSAYVYDATHDRPETVNCVRLDEVLRGTPDVIKIDIEGGELPAIRGMTRILSDGRPPAIIYEHNPHCCAAAGYRPSDIAQAILMANPHYHFHFIGWRNSRIHQAATLDRLTRHGNILATAASPTEANASRRA